MHPFAPLDQARGYLELFDDLERWLAEITGYDAVSLQPNAGSQGEYAGLLAIRKYHASRGDDGARRVPDPRVGARHERGVGRDGRHARRRRRVRRPRQRRPRRPRSARPSSTPTSSRALMVTYPSTHGVFEEQIREICAVVHDHGGQVYLDGANLNALVGVARPGQVRRRRVAPQPAQDVLHPARRRRSGRRPDRRAARTSRRSCRTIRCAPRPGPRPVSARSARRRGARPASCRSRGCTSR